MDSLATTVREATLEVDSIKLSKFCSPAYMTMERGRSRVTRKILVPSIVAGALVGKQKKQDQFMDIYYGSSFSRLE